jgi:hypothetical protein
MLGRMRRTGIAFTLMLGTGLLAAIGGSGGGCVTEDRPRADPVGPGDQSTEVAPERLPSAAATLAALAPARIRIHPLTRLERDAKGQLRLVCYLELGDQWGHPCKWLGFARVELYRPSDAMLDTGGGAAAGGERQENIWNVDLADPEKNAITYDWVTHTYRLELVGLPGWVEQLSRGESREPWATVRAYFLAAAPSGEGEKRMEASFRIRRGARSSE